MNTMKLGASVDPFVRDLVQQARRILVRGRFGVMPTLRIQSNALPLHPHPKWARGPCQISTRRAEPRPWPRFADLSSRLNLHDTRDHSLRRFVVQEQLASLETSDVD
jgi:hypothetical protein